MRKQSSAGISARHWPDINGEMKLGFMGRLFPALLSKAVWQYTADALPDVDIRELRKRQKKEYKAMVARTPSVGSVNLLMTEVTSLYLPCGRTTLLSVFHIRLFA